MRSDRLTACVLAEKLVGVEPSGDLRVSPAAEPKADKLKIEQRTRRMGVA